MERGENASGAQLSKRCGVCGEEKLLSDFYRDKKAADGRGYTCKRCSKAKAKDWYQDNPERASAARSKWKRDNPDRVKEISSRWARENRDRHNANSREWQKKNPEKVSAMRARWYSRNRMVVAERNRRWREENRERQAELTQRSRDRYPQKVAARKALHHAVERGIVVKPDRCEECGRRADGLDLHGHHEDYSKQLAVEWLCRRCHAERHPKRTHPTT